MNEEKEPICPRCGQVLDVEDDHRGVPITLCYDCGFYEYLKVYNRGVSYED